MKLSNAYRTIPYELSGAISKNRFRQEILWGVAKMFDLFNEPDFCVIFDYKCDIEVHLNSSIEFYQVKSQKSLRPYSFAELSKQKENEKGSVLGKLFILKDASCPETHIKCALVSNRFLKISRKELNDKEVICFDELDAELRAVVQKALEKELGRDSIDLRDFHYIYTSMDLVSPENAIKGFIDRSFENIKNCEPVKPNALHRLILDTVQQKACYEFAIDDADELIKHKGVTKDELNAILNQYMDTTDNSVKQVQDYIETNYTQVAERKTLKAALVKVVEAEYNARILQKKEAEISGYLNENNETNALCNSSIEDLVNVLMLTFGSTFPVEYSNQEKYVFLLLIIKRWEDGKYE